MSEQIKNIKLKFACTADWNSMPVVDGIKSCDQCQKKVYDFTGAKQDEFLKILAENNNSICGRFSAEQMAVNHPVLPAWKKWLSAALVLIGINLFNKVEAQENQNQPPASVKTTTAIKDVPVVMGEPTSIGINRKVNKALLIRYDQSANFQGGKQDLLNYVTKKVNFRNDVAGKVIITFTVNIDGSLRDYKVVTGLDDPENNMAIIKALKSSPKWTPASLYGKPVKSEFILSMTFN